MANETAHKAKYVLGIECSNPSVRGVNRGEVGLAMVGDDGGLNFVGSKGLSEDARGSDGLMGAVDSLCKAYGVGPEDVERVAVSIGPGGYTALRVSVTVAKVLSAAIGCDVVAVPTAAVAGVALDGVDAVVALASKNGKSHCTRVVGGELIVLGVIDGDELAGIGAGVLVGDEHVPGGMIDAAKAAGMEIRGIELTGRACLEASAGFEGVDRGKLAPMYAREPDAVTQWRALHG